MGTNAYGAHHVGTGQEVDAMHLVLGVMVAGCSVYIGWTMLVVHVVC